MESTEGIEPIGSQFKRLLRLPAITRPSLERDTGLEPVLSIWKTDMLPLNINPALVAPEGVEPPKPCF
jgi:hypothetical protein